ncbi:MAG: hypothetical protein DRP68_04895 [Candidatus Omnitrophota bacterium]|nr:MAG: hypothetical protein DRP68_04895 [Candidatus Omnitrophota bacterium]
MSLFRIIDTIYYSLFWAMGKVLKIGGIFLILPLSVLAECEIGAFFGQNPPTKGVINEFEDMIGKDISSVLWYEGWSRFYQPPFNTNFLNDNVRYHDGYDTKTTLHITLEPWVNLEDINQGVYDSYLRNYAYQAKQWGDEIRLRFGHEMIQDDNPRTSGWYSWQDKPQEYKEAFKHVYNIFRNEVGATNVKFVWSPNYTPDELEVLEKYYPGKDYVDWIGLDGYNWGWPWTDFDQIFYEIYQNIVQNPDIFGDKPIMLGEFASSEGELKDEWIREAFQKIKDKYPQIKAFYWFNIDKERDWRVNSSPEALTTFKEAIGVSYFTSHPSGGDKIQDVVNPADIEVRVNIPRISMLKVNVTRIENDNWQSDSEVNFGSLIYDPGFHILRSSCYYAIDVGIFSNDYDWSVTHTVSSVTNGIDILDENINVVFVKQNNDNNQEKLAELSFIKSNGISFDKASLEDGWLRIYYGIGAGSGDASGVKPITIAKSAGTYKGTITITLTP